MGYLWGDEYSIQTSAVSSPFFNESASADPWELIPLKAVMNDVSISRVYKNELMTGLGVKIERAYAFASDINLYGHGLLNHTILSGSTGHKETKAYLETLHGSGVVLEYHRLDTLNMEHVGQEYLTNTQGYTAVSNLSTVQSDLKGFPVYVEHMALKLQVAPLAVTKPVEQMPEWGAAPKTLYTPWTNPFTAIDSWEYTTSEISLITLHFAYMSATPVPGTPTALDWDANGVPEEAIPPDLSIQGINRTGFSFEAAYGLTTAASEDFIYRYTIEVPLYSLGYAQDQDYFQTRYLANILGAPVIKYFTHADQAGTIASIENTATLGNNTPTFFPLIFIRRRFITLAKEVNAEVLEYKQAKAICNVIGFDYQQFATSVLEEADEDDLSQVFIQFGIPVDTSEQVGQRYLFEFFYWLNLDNADLASQRYYQDGDWFHDSHTPKKAIHFTDNSAHIRLEFVGTSSRLLTGFLTTAVEGGLGSCDSTLLYQYQSYYAYGRNIVNGEDLGYIRKTYRRLIPVWRYRKQINASKYIEVLVAEPRLSYKLLDQSGGSVRYAYVQDDENLLIPLNHELAHEHFLGFERKQLYALSMHVQANAYVKTRLSWYETDRFRVVMTITAIVIVALSLGTMTETVYQVYTAIFALIGNTAAAVILTTLIVVGVQVGLAKVFSLLVEEIGTKWGSIGAALLAVIAIIATAKGLPGADKWVLAANGFADGVQLQIEENIVRIEENLIRLTEEYEDFLDIRKEYEDDLAIMDRLLEATGLVSVHNPYETAEQFFTRTASGTEAMNIAVNEPEIFFQTALRLPETAGEI